VAVGMYSPTDNPVTEFADPGKLKAYLAAGLPIVINDIPHNAGELAAQAGAEVVPYDPESLADAIQSALASEDEWRERRRAANDNASSTRGASTGRQCLPSLWPPSGSDRKRACSRLLHAPQPPLTHRYQSAPSG